MSSLLNKFITISILQPKLSLSETTHNFAGVVVNNKADREFTITNTGIMGGLVVSSISLGGDPEFSITSDNCTAQPLEGNASCTFIVRFSPTAQGAFTGNISVASNDPPARTINLSGDGYGLNVWINKIDSASCSSVVVDVTVTNPNGSLDILTDSNFTFKQNGVPQTITGFTTTDPDSVSAVVDLDLSASLDAALGDIKTAAVYFVDNLNDGDEAAICKFKKDIDFYPIPSSPDTFLDTYGTELAQLKSYINASEYTLALGTSLYDAVYASITRAATGAKSKKAVIVLSDGCDENSSEHTLEDVINYAAAENIPIFTIYYVDQNYASTAKPALLQQLAEETGGQAYSADTSTMDVIFSQISALLSKKYTITYTPTSCTGSQLLEVDALSSGSLTGLDTKTIVFP
jgi:VWFA-related protein